MLARLYFGILVDDEINLGMVSVELADVSNVPSYDLYWGIFHDKVVAVGARIV